MARQNQNQNQNQNRNQNQNQRQNQNQNQNQNQDQNQNQNQSRNSDRNSILNSTDDFSLRETRPSLGGGRVPGNDRFGTAFDLVEQMHYLYVRIVKAKSLPPKRGNTNNLPDPYIDIKLGNFTASTKHFENNPNPEWNQVFAFPKDRIQSLTLELIAKDKDKDNPDEDDFIGGIVFDLSELPVRVPPDSPLAAQWYRLENVNGGRDGGELMVAVWMGTQADESFPDAWHLDALLVNGDGVNNIRSKVYLSPRLWYVRVQVIEAQELQNINNGSNRQPEVLVKGVIMNMVLRTKVSPKPSWNEDLMFVVAEPFEEKLVLSVEEKLVNKEEVLGKCLIPLHNVEKRMDNRVVASKWYNLEKHTRGENGKVEVVVLNSRIHLRVCLDGGYHVLDELTQYSSDLRATSRLLGSPSIGVLELGILNAQGLAPMKTRNGRGAVDAYCVAKYGSKWIRTRTVIDSLNPKWNEQYTWEVFDPCTVITIVVFDNCHLQGVDNGGGSKDPRIGKIRIRLSTLETDRVYTHSYPLIVLHPSGVKKMGEIQLAVRFTCVSLLNLMQVYSQPLLPQMHYIQPLTIFQQDSLRHQATQIVSMRLNRAEPPLRKEVVEYMLDVGSTMWSLRKSKANYCRIIEVLSGVVLFFKWFNHICNWSSPSLTVLVHVLFVVLVLYPQMIFSTMLFYLLLIGIWKYRLRPRHPPHMDIKLSHGDKSSADELDEEFDGFPSSKSGDALRMRYDRLRSVGSRVQTVIGDLATQGERIQNLITWRDPRATAMFLVFCFVLAIFLYVIPIRFVVLAMGFFVLRHPRFRHRLPSLPMNFFRRLPARTDGLL